MNRSNSDPRWLQQCLGLLLAVLVSVSAWGGDTGYRLDYDYPQLTSGAYGPSVSMPEPWRDYGALSAIPSQQGVDYPEVYLPRQVRFRQGPPTERLRHAHTRYEFLYRFAPNCVQSVSFPCTARLFEDRFERP